jgi:MFS family permease
MRAGAEEVVDAARAGRRIGWNRSFRALLGAQVCATVGDGIRQAAFPLLAYALTDDYLQVAGLTFALMLPWLLFSLPAGAIADRFDRRRLLVLMSVARAAVLVGLAASVLTGTASIPVLYAAAFAVGVTHVVFATASQAVVPATVERSRLEPANARIAIAEIVGNEFMGPMVGGVLFALAVYSPFLAIAGLAVLGSLAASQMRGDFRPAQDPAEAGQSLTRNIVVGLRWLLRHRVLRIVAFASAMMALVDTAAVAILVIYAAEIHGISEVGYGVLIAVSGIGGITGSLIAGRIARGTRTLPVMLTGVALLAMAQFGLAAAPEAVVAGLALFAGGVAYGLWGVVSLTLRQRLAPDALLARAGAGHRLFALGGSAVGALFGGVMATMFGLRAAYAIGGVLVVVVFVVVSARLTSHGLAKAIEAAESGRP